MSPTKTCTCTSDNEAATKVNILIESPEDILRYHKKYPNDCYPQVIKIVYHTDTIDSELLKKFPNTTSLKITGIQSSMKGVEYLENLTQLEMDLCNFYDFTEISKCSMIKSLQIDDVVCRFLTGIEKLSNLVKVQHKGILQRSWCHFIYNKSLSIMSRKTLGKINARLGPVHNNIVLDLNDPSFDERHHNITNYAVPVSRLMRGVMPDKIPAGMALCGEYYKDSAFTAKFGDIFNNSDNGNTLFYSKKLEDIQTEIRICKWKREDHDYFEISELNECDLINDEHINKFELDAKIIGVFRLCKSCDFIDPVHLISINELLKMIMYRIRELKLENQKTILNAILSGIFDYSQEVGPYWLLNTTDIIENIVSGLSQFYDDLDSLDKIQERENPVLQSSTTTTSSSQQQETTTDHVSGKTIDFVEQQKSDRAKSLDSELQSPGRIEQELRNITQEWLKIAQERRDLGQQVKHIGQKVNEFKQQIREVNQQKKEFEQQQKEFQQQHKEFQQQQKEFQQQQKEFQQQSMAAGVVNENPSELLKKMQEFIENMSQM